MPSAASTQVKSSSISRIARELGETARKVKNPSGGLVFISGGLIENLTEVAEQIAQTVPKVPLIVATGAGVLTERGEIEGETAASAVFWSGGRTEALTIKTAQPSDLNEGLARALGDRLGRASLPVFLFVDPTEFEPHTLSSLQEVSGTRHIFGAGTVSSPGVMAIDAEGQLSSGGAAALVLRGLSPPQIRSSPACRLVTPFYPITEIRGAMVMRLGDEPALDVLGSIEHDSAERAVVFAALADEAGSSPTQAGRPEMVVRGVQGIDPEHRGLLVSQEVRVGMRMALGIRDATAARDDLEAIGRELHRDTAGAAPRFGLYLNCAGRGSNLYGAYDVDTRILKARFDKTPIAGMQSSFEIAPHSGKPTMQLYTGVFALFTAPS